MRKHKLTLKTTINFRFYLLIVQVNEMIFMSSLCVCSNSKNIQDNLFRSYFMIINERNNIVKYSIICMFRKHFEAIVLFSEIILVLLQAYLLIL